MTDLESVREPVGVGAVIGRLFVDGAAFCWTLEPTEHAAHPPIPAGTYKVRLTYSGRFQRTLPELLEVPGRSGIRVHPGNDAGDTLGCILLGFTRDGDTIGESRKACDIFQSQLLAALVRGTVVKWTVRDAPAEGVRT